MGIILRDDTSELLNVVDEKGHLFTDDRGKILTVPRGIAHTYGIRHETTNVLLVSPNSTPEDVKVYLQRRSSKKRLFPGAWTVSCGGHMGTSIDPVKSAVREAEEELGLPLNPEQLIPLCNSRIGFPNLLKVWRYKGGAVTQMGSSPSCFGFAQNSVPRKIQDYVEGIGLLDFPAENALEGLELEVFNRESCLYFLYFLTHDDIKIIEFKDEEADGLKEVLLADFLNTPRSERTDSSETLLVYCPDLLEVVCNNLKDRGVK